AKVEGSWGDATPGAIKFCIWLKDTLKQAMSVVIKKIKNIRTIQFLNHMQGQEIRNDEVLIP
ncbi:hypothetical protein Tco_0574628, partial [Tanacetum coccineum]